ncbi:TetR family transcriptional regulator [Thiolapillus sp.]|uniref:TetR family transcriptional regulator n=1 Tax=Thiolapillus sp. TaxID=2017437 RepID=UPI003AF83537
MALSEKAQATREKIIAAATELFYRNGYHATGLDKVIRQAGVTKGNFYYHFPSKEALAIATLDWQYERWSEEIREQVFSQRIDALETLLNLLDYMADRQKKQHEEGQIRGCYFGNFALELSTVSPAVCDKVNAVFSSYAALIEALLRHARKKGQIRESVDPGQLASVILGQVEGAILLDKARHQPGNFDQSIKFIRQYLETD